MIVKTVGKKAAMDACGWAGVLGMSVASVPLAVGLDMLWMIPFCLTEVALCLWLIKRTLSQNAYDIHGDFDEA